MQRAAYRSFLPAMLLLLAPLAACTSSLDDPDGEREDTCTVASDLISPIGPIGPIGPGTPVPPLPPGTTPVITFRALRGTMQCLGQPLANIPFDIAGRRVITSATGTFEVPVTLPGVGALNQNVTFIYEGPITSDGATTPVRVMDELKNTRTEARSLTGGWGTSSAGQLAVEFGVVNLTSLDCELYRLGRLALLDFHATRHASPPDHALEIERLSAVNFGTPYTFYDHLVIHDNWLAEADAGWREHTIFHEFGHSIRHVADGPEDHWNWDNFRWAYARTHNGDEIFNTQYAFNEGWADYWEASRHVPASVLPVPAGMDPRNVHWNENMIANRLVADSRLPGASRRMMVEILEANPGTIHSLNEFETRLFARLGRAAPPAPPSCPIGWTDDGATCRTGGEVIAKSSYGRGVGTPPTNCGAGNVYDAGLCYPACRENFDNFGVLCIEDCPAGYHDDGLFCRRDVDIFGNGCGGGCPAGYTNDGCTCRRDADIFPKHSYDRGVGWVPSACDGSKVMDAGLCYDACTKGWSSAGPVCYSPCPEGFVDDGALCRKPLAILVKY